MASEIDIGDILTSSAFVATVCTVISDTRLGLPTHQKNRVRVPSGLRGNLLSYMQLTTPVLTGPHLVRPDEKWREGEIIPAAGSLNPPSRDF
jgi:hypothetical protein